MSVDLSPTAVAKVSPAKSTIPSRQASRRSASSWEILFTSTWRVCMTLACSFAATRRRRRTPDRLSSPSQGSPAAPKAAQPPVCGRVACSHPAWNRPRKRSSNITSRPRPHRYIALTREQVIGCDGSVARDSVGGSECTRRWQAQPGPQAAIQNCGSDLLMQRPENLVRAAHRKPYRELKKWFHNFCLKWILLGASSRLILGS
jgi:hypothetical protein